MKDTWASKEVVEAMVVISEIHGAAEHSFAGSIGFLTVSLSQLNRFWLMEVPWKSGLPRRASMAPPKYEVSRVLLGPILRAPSSLRGEYVAEDYEAVVDKKSNLIETQLRGSSHFQHRQCTGLKQVADGQVFQVRDQLVLGTNCQLFKFGLIRPLHLL